MNKFQRSEQVLKSFETGNQPQIHLSACFAFLFKKITIPVCQALWYVLGI